MPWLAFSKVIAPQDSLFCSHVLLHHCISFSLPSPLNCLANISARERQISLFPVDIVLSELARHGVNNLAPILFLGVPFCYRRILPHRIFSSYAFLHLPSFTASFPFPHFRSPKPPLVVRVCTRSRCLWCWGPLSCEAMPRGPWKARQPNTERLALTP